MVGYYFKGRLNVTPQAMTQVNDSAMLPAGPDVGNVAAFIGHSTGGQPGVVLTFDNPEDAVAALGSGDLVDAIVRAFSPSNDTGGPAEVKAIRIDEATQSALTLRDSTAAAVVNLTSIGYGIPQNQIKVKVEAATGGTGLKITLMLGTASFVGDNIFRNAFQIQYTGGQASAVMQVNQTQVVLQAPSGTTVATLNLNTFQTIQQLVDAINATTGFTASVLSGNGAQAALNGLDTVAAQDVKTAAYTATAHLQALVDWFNNGGNPFVTAARVAGAGTLPAVMGFTYLTGAATNADTNTDWSNAFALLQTEDVQMVTPLTSTPAIWSMADAHVQYMSDQGRMERRATVGPASGTSDTTAISDAQALNSDRTSLVHLGVYDYDVVGNGSLKLYPPYITAAMIAGMATGVNPGTPLTSKSLRVQGVERKLSNPGNTDALLIGGVLPIEQTKTGVRITQSISTWLTDGRYDKREISVGVATDYASRYIRETVEAAVKGKKATPQTLALALSTMETCCQQLAVPEESGGPGVLAGDKNGPAYKNLTGQIQGDAIILGGQISPVLPVNYIPISINVVPYSGTASIAA